MHQEKLFEQVQSFLQRNLSPEEQQFLILAAELRKPQDKPLPKAGSAGARVA